MRVFFQLGTTISLTWMAVPADAQISDPNVKTCVEKSGHEAIAGCTAAITSGKVSTSNLATLFSNRGIEWSNKHDFARAIADFNEAIRLNPQIVLAFYNRGLAYYSQKDFARAIADYSEAIRLNPQYAAAFMSRGLVNLTQANWAAAFADFETSSRLIPNSPWVLYGRGLAALHVGKAAEGQADIAAATKANAGVAKVYADMGLIL